MSLRSPVVLLFVLVTGCSIHASGYDLPDDEDAGDARDGGTPPPPAPGTDAGPGTKDAATSDDAGPPETLDSGSEPLDSGLPPMADAGPPPATDAGPPSGAVGSACGWDGDCEPGLSCYVTSWTPGGYCTRPCSTHAECGAWGGCATFMGYQYCGRLCRSHTECRPGYYCAATTTGSYCYPS